MRCGAQGQITIAKMDYSLTPFWFPLLEIPFSGFDHFQKLFEMPPSGFNPFSKNCFVLDLTRFLKTLNGLVREM